MGDIMEIQKATTIRQEIAAGNISYNAAWKRWGRRFPEMPFDQDRELTGDELALLGLVGGNFPAMPRVIKETPAEKQEKPVDWRNLSLRIGLIAITLTTVGMLFVGGWLLWKWVGLLTAATVSVFLICAQVLATDRRKTEASEHAIAVCFLIELCAAWLHNATFRNWLEADREMAGSAWAVCWVLAFLFSAISFAAIWVSRRMTVDDDLFNAFNPQP